MTLQPLSMIRKYLIITVCSGFIAACGGGGGSSSTPTTANAGGSGNISNATSTSTVSLTPSKTQTEVNDYVTLTWSSQNATSCTASGNWNGTKSLSGSEDIRVTEEKTYTYTLTCSGASASVNVAVDDPETEGTCRNPHTAEFDEKFMGKFEIPSPQYMLPDDMIKAVGLKDYGVEWIYNNYKQDTYEPWINNCTVDQYVRLMYKLTLRRLKEHGAEHVTVYNYGYWNDANASHWTLAHGTKHIDDYDMQYIVETANSMGLKIHYVWQFLPVDRYNRFLFSFPGATTVDMPLLEKIMNAHEENMLWQADFAQKIGINSLSIDWSAMWLCFCGLNYEYEYDDPRRKELEDYYMHRLSLLIDEVRKVFQGDIYVGEGPLWNDHRVMSKVDYAFLGVPTKLLTEEENNNPTVNLVTEKVQDYFEEAYYKWYCLNGQACPTYATQDKVPFVVQLFGQSTRNFLNTGWIEDGFCTDGNMGDMGGGSGGCMQYNVEIDFSVQAIYTEAVMRASYMQTFWDFKGFTVSTGYWLSDTLQPDPNQTRKRTIEGFPNISQSIRGKPAEKILKYWYTGEYEEYRPKFK